MKNISWYAVAFISFLLFATLSVTRSFSNVQEMQLNRPISDLPIVLDNFKSRDIDITEDVYNILKTDDLLYREYTESSGEKVDVFMSYHRKQTSEAHPHSPRICMPANGFENTDSGKKTIRLDNGEKFTVIREEYSKGTDKIIAWYWYQTGDRRMSSEYLQKFYMILDGIFKRRTDVAFIRITINTDAQGVKSAEKTFEKFVKVLVPALNQIIPN